MNTAGQLGAFLSPIILPYLLKDQGRAEDWALPLFIAGGLYIAGAFCWLLVDPAKAARHEARGRSVGIDLIERGPGPLAKRGGDLLDQPIDLSPDDPWIGTGLEGDQVAVAAGRPRAA